MNITSRKIYKFSLHIASSYFLKVIRTQYFFPNMYFRFFMFTEMCQSNFPSSIKPTLRNVLFSLWKKLYRRSKILLAFQKNREKAMANVRNKSWIRITSWIRVQAICKFILLTKDFPIAITIWAWKIIYSSLFIRSTLLWDFRHSRWYSKSNGQNPLSGCFKAIII